MEKLRFAKQFFDEFDHPNLNKDEFKIGKYF